MLHACRHLRVAATGLKSTGVAALLLTGLLCAGRSEARGVREAGRFPVIGYYPSWSADVGGVQYSKLTHINYSFGNTDASGNISIANAARMRDMMERAHQAGVKVGLAIGGWAAGTAAFEAMAGNATARAAFIRNAVALCDEGLDGIDMDWEYPVAGSAANYALLMKELGTALHAKGKYLSAAVIADGDYYGQHIRASVFESLDFLNIMAYDATHTAHHSSYENAIGSLDYWVNRRKLPQHKAVLGVPFYGRSINGGDSYVSYKDVVNGNASLAQSDISNGLYYNGIPTIQRKTELSFQQGGGIMIWELSQDATGSFSLLSAIHSKAQTFPAVGIRRAGAPGRLSVTGQGLLRWRAPSPGSYALRILSLSGALLAGGASETAAAGTCDFRLDRGGLPAGAYLAEVSGPAGPGRPGARFAVRVVLP